MTVERYGKIVACEDRIFKWRPEDTFSLPPSITLRKKDQFFIPLPEAGDRGQERTMLGIMLSYRIDDSVVRDR